MLTKCTICGAHVTADIAVRNACSAAHADQAEKLRALEVARRLFTPAPPPETIYAALNWLRAALREYHP